MPAIVEIIEGPLKGKEFELRPGMKLGRSGSDLNLKDPKVSSAHAEIRLRTGSVNKLVIFDLGSTNGIKTGGKRATSIDLEPGISIQLGNSVLKVVSVDITDGDMPKQEMADWRSHLLRLASKILPAKSPKSEVRPFKEAVSLKITRGPQAGESYLLGYGPRTIGKLSADFNLIDPSASEATFELIPLPNGQVEFRTENLGLVRLNGLSKRTETIKTGDTIEIGKTAIEISFR